MSHNFKKFGLLILLLVGSTGITQQAQAYTYWHPYHSSYSYHPASHWVYDRHDGRLGWWWVNGAFWAFYPRPYPVYPAQTIVVQQVPAPAPQVIVAPAAPAPAPVQVVQAPPPVLYYCKSTETYYPQTMTCPGGWTTMAAGAPPADAVPPTPAAPK